MTKLISFAPALAALALVTSVGAASAENTFQHDRAGSSASSVALTNVQADQAGTLEVYSRDGDGVGQFLGAAQIEAGTTGAVDVGLNQPARGRLLVVMMNGNHSVAKMNVRDALTN